VIFTAGRLPGSWLLDLEPREDERGFFARTFCREEFGAHGLECGIAQANVSYNRRRGTLRGLHFQREPFAEAKVVQCTAGAIHDVIVDLRPRSPTHGSWEAYELSASNRRMLYVPPGFAHGFQTLADDSVVAYLMMQAHAPEHADGVRWDDPAFAITWPVRDPIVSARDRSYAPYVRPSG